MISCPAYGLPVSPGQCEAARERFWLERICAGCIKEEVIHSVTSCDVMEQGVTSPPKPRRTWPAGMSKAVA